jgi:WbqC-like protein family
MSDILLHPTYFPSVSHFVAMAQADTITFEVEDNFQKQTNRNRMYIYSPNGIQLLNIPVKHNPLAGHQKFKDVKIETAFDWQKQHFKSLEAAYRTSPFFEYFEDDIRPVFEKKHTYMMDLNFQVMEIVCQCLGMPFEYSKTQEYFHKAVGFDDLRTLANGKKDANQFEAYTQVFGDRHGYINNLSILDLLFNEGRYAMEYLKRQKLIK